MTNPFLIVLSLLAVSMIAATLTGSALYFRLSYLWGGLLLLNWIMSRLSLRGIRISRTARSLRSQVGQVFEERFEIQNTSRLPCIWVEVRDRSPVPGSCGSHVLTLIGGRESRTYLSRTRLVERGIFPLGPTDLISGDLFGFFPARRIIPSRDSVLVYPRWSTFRASQIRPACSPGEKRCAGVPPRLRRMRQGFENTPLEIRSIASIG